VQPRVDTFGQRKTAHVYGAVSLDADFFYRFEPVFNAKTFHVFLQDLVRAFAPRKVFLIIDNGPAHWLDEDGRRWLHANRRRIELFRLPPYSPEFNPMEGIWKTTRRRTTHNRFFRTVEERDAALVRTFVGFQRCPSRIAGHVARFRDN
jgi:transposase